MYYSGCYVLYAFYINARVSSSKVINLETHATWEQDTIQRHTKQQIQHRKQQR